MLPNHNQGYGVIRRKPKAKKPHKLKTKHAPQSQYNRLDDPAAVTAPQTLRQIGHAADQAVGLQYGPQQRALYQMRSNLPAWFQQYRDQAKASAGQVQARYDTAVGDVGTQTAATQTANDQSRKELLKAAQADAASRGATVDPKTFLEDAAAASIRRQGGDAFANLLRSQGNATGDYFGGLQTASAAQQIGAQQTNARDIAALGSTMGQAKAGYITDAQQQAHTNQLADAAFNLDTFKAQTTAGNQAATRRAAAQKQKAAQHDRNQDQGLAGRKFKSAQEKDAYQRANHLGPYKLPAPPKTGLTPAQKAKREQDSSDQVIRITDAEGRWNIYKKHKGTVKDPTTGKTITRPPNPDEIKQRLIKEGFSTQEIHLALMWSSQKPWTAHDRQLAKRLGIKLPARKKVKLPPKSKANSPVDPRGLLNPSTYP